MRCLGQNFSQKSDLYLKKSLVQGSGAACGRTFPSNLTSVLKKSFVWGNGAAWGRTFHSFFVRACVCVLFFVLTICLGQLRCLGQHFFSKACFFWKKPLVPGSCAAWGRTVPRIPTCFEETICPGQLLCLEHHVFLFREILVFLKKSLFPLSTLTSPVTFLPCHAKTTPLFGSHSESYLLLLD